MIKPNFKISDVDWEKGQGLVPCIVQDSKSRKVLMLGYVVEPEKHNKKEFTPIECCIYMAFNNQ